MDGKEKESYCILLDGEGKREKARRSAITFEKNYSVDTCFIQADTGPFLSPLSLYVSQSLSLCLPLRQLKSFLPQKTKTRS